MKNILLKIAFVATCFQSKFVYSQEPVNDCKLLEDIFTQWNRNDLVTWDSSIDGSCCDMTSIVCDPHHGYYRIAELKLRQKGFTGTIPREITKLKYLNYLTLAENSLSGTLPDNLDELIYLTKFSLRSNQLEGQIPNNIGNIDGIFHLDLSGNKFTGNIPSSFANLKQLQFLNLTTNLLQGYIPESFRGLKKLTTFQLEENNQLSGYVPLIPTVSNCTYEQTNLCYLDGAICKSTAHQCSTAEIEDTRKNNGYNDYSEDKSNNSSNNSSCNCNLTSNDSLFGSIGNYFSNMGLIAKILVGVILLVIIGLILYCIFGGKSKHQHNSPPPSRRDYINYY
ncbi:L domain-like protein [Anaeromyces robustus]|uniref:L domain-like protein n=1 Tax=Anaeromyces robustus TaxID=1754192 RepID=A0A1Y1X546_9FUNG|nr:L domain-like protein [Anaeromyces robustus]|eukprot:ORX80941.1 L domain-like protein [Anaeromyces robustus]